MFGFDLDHGNHMSDDRWPHITWFPTYHTLDATLGYISVSDEIYRSWWSCTLIPTYGMCTEMMTWSLFLRWFLSRAFREPSNLTCTSRHSDDIVLPSERSILNLWAWFCYRFRWPGLHICWCMTLMSFDFPDLSHIWCHTGAYFRIRSRFPDPHLFAWLTPATRYTSYWWFCFISPWLWWIFSWVVSLGSWFLMSVWLLDGVVSSSWIFTLSFCRVHVRSSIHPHRVAHESSGQIGYIWCHTRAYFPPSSTEMIVLSQSCYSFHHSVEGYRICFMSHCFGDIHWDELSLERDIQIVIVTLVDYSLEIP